MTCLINTCLRPGYTELYHYCPQHFRDHVVQYLMELSHTAEVAYQEALSKVYHFEVREGLRAAPYPAAIVETIEEEVSPVTASPRPPRSSRPRTLKDAFGEDF